MKLLIAVAMAVSLFTPGANASEATTTVEHYAPIPCAILCPHWAIASPVIQPNPCAEDLQRGSFDQTVVQMTTTDPFEPATIEMRPTLDYDMVFCSVTDPPVELFWNRCPSAAKTSCVPTEPDCEIASPIYLGCRETVQVTNMALIAEHGYLEPRFMIRSFNWFDVGSATIELSGPIEVIDDTFEAEVL